MGKKYKYLLKNIGLLTISSFGSKILSILIVPLYTSILSTSEYGSYDLINTVVSLLIPIFTLNICEAVLRFSLDKNNSKSDILLESGIICIAGSLIVITCSYFMKKVGLFATIEHFWLEFVLFYLSSVIYLLVSNFVRGVEAIEVLSISGIISTLVILLSNILFLIIFKWGIIGYLWAMILGNIIPVIYMSIAIKIWEYRSFKRSINLRNEMIIYSAPLIANSIAWWVNSALDRFIVTWLCGIDINGIYSIAYKIPSILTIFSNIFNQAWILSSVKEYKKDEDSFYEQTFKLYNFLLVIVCSILIGFTKIISRMLFANEFYNAWHYIPFLLISVVFGAVSGYFGGIYAAMKNSKLYAISTVTGAFVNLILNLILVSRFGAVGAAASTLISYCVVMFIRYYNIRKIMGLSLGIKTISLDYCILLIQAITLLRCSSIVGLVVIQTILFILLLLFNFQNIKGVVDAISTRMKPRY